MSFQRGPGLERKVGRRGAKKALLFKENQVLIGTETTKKTHKRKKNDRHVAVELPEFQLLVKLYVPANLLIKNNQVSVKQLTAYLPELVDGRFPELNFELHIFLGSLVNVYVLSWYEKLNTENLAFVYDVYETLCVFVKDVSSRILGIVELPKLLDLANQIAQILDLHVRDNLVDNGGSPKFAQLLNHRSLHTIIEETDIHSLRIRYLLENHIMFDPQWALENAKLGFGIEVSTLTSMETEKTDVLPGLQYLKVLVKHIIQTAFSDEKPTVKGPRLSAIITNFLTVLLADLVLGKIVAKLSAPEFLISTVFGGIAANLKHTLDQEPGPESESTPSLRFQSVKAYCEKLFYNASSASTAFRKYLWTPENNPTIFFSPVMSLFDAITNFSGRQPVIVSLMRFARSLLFSIGNLGPKLDNFVGTYLLEQTRKSVITDDLTLAHVIETLRCSLFDKTNYVGSAPTKPKTVEEVRDDIFEILSRQMKASHVLLLWFEHTYETEKDIKNSIEKFLRIFDLEIREAPTMELKEKKSDMNLLLIMKVFDCVVQNIYPEMTMTLSSVA